VDSFTVSSEKTGEGEFRIILSSDLPEAIDVDIRMRQAEIGYDYRSTYNSMDPIFYSSFDIDNNEATIPGNGKTEFNVRMNNLYQINRSFYTNANIYIRTEDMRWKIFISIGDEELFKDVKYLRSLNTTDYWHPRMIQENWEEYLHHIGE
jgi:hypothetical protein